MKRFLVITLFLLSAACHKQEGIDFAPASSPAAAANKTNPHALQTSYADAVERVGSGVVTVRTARHMQAIAEHSSLSPSVTDPSSSTPSEASPPTLQVSLGSGVVVRPDGTILTNYHVINGAEAITVELTDHRLFDAKMIGSDPPSDLALLKIEAKNLAALTLADSDRVRVGDVALAIGNPLGIGQTVTAGIISAKGRSTGLGGGDFEDFLQTDAPINQGNSGGALINIEGELVGINSQILSTSGASIGIGFAIPSNMARSVVNQLITTGRVRRSRLGIAIQSMTPDEASKAGLADPRGVRIRSVAPDGPAARAGMRVGDVILAFNGAPVTDSNALRNHVANTPPGSQVKFMILRNQRQQNVRVILGEYEAGEPQG
jgi:Do/DeqQ family serine protease